MDAALVLLKKDKNAHQAMISASLTQYVKSVNGFTVAVAASWALKSLPIALSLVALPFLAKYFISIGFHPFKGRYLFSKSNKSTSSSLWQPYTPTPLPPIECGSDGYPLQLPWPLTERSKRKRWTKVDGQWTAVDLMPPIATVKAWIVEEHQFKEQVKQLALQLFQNLMQSGLYTEGECAAIVDKLKVCTVPFI